MTEHNGVCSYLLAECRGRTEKEADKACRCLNQLRRFLNKRGVFCADELS